MRLMTPTGRLASVGACPVPTTPSRKFACVAQKAARTGHAWSNEELCVRALLTNHGFTISVFVAVAIMAVFAFVFEAAPELVTAVGPGHPDGSGGIRHAFEFGAPAMTATT